MLAKKNPLGYDERVRKILSIVILVVSLMVLCIVSSEAAIPTPFGTPRPTPTPIPKCSKANIPCTLDENCRVSSEPGCSAFYCITNITDITGVCLPIVPTKPPLPTPRPSVTSFQPDCKRDPEDLNPTPRYYLCQTAIGEISTNPTKLIAQLLRILLGLGGGIALLLIIFSGYKMATSSGNPEAIQGARETLTAAIVGLLFIILSLVILEVIGVDILAVPGFSR